MGWCEELRQSIQYLYRWWVESVDEVKFWCKTLRTRPYTTLGSILTRLAVQSLLEVKSSATFKWMLIVFSVSYWGFFFCGVETTEDIWSYLTYKWVEISGKLFLNAWANWHLWLIKKFDCVFWQRLMCYSSLMVAQFSENFPFWLVKPDEDNLSLWCFLHHTYMRTSIIQSILVNQCTYSLGIV